MEYLPIILIVWGVVVACFLVLFAHNDNLSRYEEGQFFLSDSNEVEEHSQEEIFKKVERVQPYIRVVGSLTALVTLGLVGIMGWAAWQKLH